MYTFKCDLPLTFDKKMPNKLIYIYKHFKCHLLQGKKDHFHE